VLEGHLRHIQYASQADVAYDGAVEYSASCGFGCYRITTEYVDDETWAQEPRIKRILDPMTVYFDPDCQEPDFSDASPASDHVVFRLAVFGHDGQNVAERVLEFTSLRSLISPDDNTPTLHGPPPLALPENMAQSVGAGGSGADISELPTVELQWLANQRRRQKAHRSGVLGGVPRIETQRNTRGAPPPLYTASSYTSLTCFRCS
jgi:hypothetical protein